MGIVAFIIAIATVACTVATAFSDAIIIVYSM